MVEPARADSSAFFIFLNRILNCLYIKAVIDKLSIFVGNCRAFTFTEIWLSSTQVSTDRAKLPKAIQYHEHTHCLIGWVFQTTNKGNYYMKRNKTGNDYEQNTLEPAKTRYRGWWVVKAVLTGLGFNDILVAGFLVTGLVTVYS